MSSCSVPAPHAPGRFDEEAAWRAVVARETDFDGALYYAVKTTGIYCRPSCPARKPNRANVVFFSSAADAARAGYRPCKRCKPDEAVVPVWSQRIEQACRLMETAETPMPLTALADAVGLSPHHFHRQFKRALGITPKAYAAALQQARVRTALRRGQTVTDALYEAGFSSSGRFYSDATATLGMTPRAVRRGGAAERLIFATAPCALGHVLVAASPKGVCAILLGDSADDLARELRTLFPRAALDEGDAAFAKTMAAVVTLVDAPSRESRLPLDIRGTAFQRRVWEALRKIPPGETRSYGALAEAIGAPRAVRAVASACAANTLAVAVPCHRVVRRDGSLSGYRWGQDRKRALLDREKS